MALGLCGDGRVDNDSRGLGFVVERVQEEEGVGRRFGSDKGKTRRLCRSTENVSRISSQFQVWWAVQNVGIDGQISGRKAAECWTINSTTGMRCKKSQCCWTCHDVPSIA